VGTLIGVIFPLGYIMALFVHKIIGQRVSAEDELEGLDIPEIGSFAYPEFVLRPSSAPGGTSPAMKPATSAASGD
jgi:Amt family ammonium transporter